MGGWGYEVQRERGVVYKRGEKEGGEKEGGQKEKYAFQLP